MPKTLLLSDVPITIQKVVGITFTAEDYQVTAVDAIGCAFAGLCYSEFSCMIPVAGSAYTYAYTTLGEWLAWIWSFM